MSIALVAGSVKTSTILSSATPRATAFTATTVVGNKLICCVGFGANPTSVSVSDAFHGAWTQIGSLVANGTTAYVAIFYVDSTHALTSSDNVSVAFTGTVINWVGLSEWSGVASGAPANSVSNTATSSTPSTGALTTGAVGDLVLGVFGLASAQTFTVGTDNQGSTMTSLHAPTAGASRSFGVEYLVEAGALAYTPKATWGGSGAWAAEGVRFAAAATAPTNSVAPAVTGTARRGQTLSTTDGTWTGSPSFTYQWKRAGVSIGGATSSTYVLVQADIGSTIKCTVTATNGGGSLAVDSNSTLAVSQARTLVGQDARIEFCANSMTATRQVGINPVGTSSTTLDQTGVLVVLF